MKENPARTAQRLPPWLGALLLVVATCVAYYPALHGEMVWDDDAWMTDTAPLMDHVGGLWEMWSRPTALQQYYPLTGTTFWLDHQLWGTWTLPYHLENVLLHATGALLFWGLLKKLETPGAWLAAAVLALHPVMVESVAWMAERKNVLSLVLFLAALLFYARSMAYWKRAEPQVAQRRSYGLALLLFAAALLAKASVFALPAVCLLIAWWKRGRLRWRQDVRPTLPFFLLAVLFSLGVLWLEKNHVGAAGADWDVSWAERWVRAGRAWWFYLGKLAWPADLPPIYPHWQMQGTPWSAWLWPCSAVLVLLGSWMLRDRAGRAMPAALLMYSGTLFPVLGFLNVYGMLYAPVADRWVYLPSLPLIALLAAAAALVAQRWQRAWLLPALAAVILPALMVRTWRQSHLYRDNETLMSTALRLNPQCWVAAYNLGNIRATQGRQDEAVALLQQTLAIYPRHEKARNNLGNSLLEMGRTDEAIEMFEQSLALTPEIAATHYNLGNALMQMGRLDEAMGHFERAVAARPDFADAHGNLAVVLFAQGNVAASITHSRRVVEIQPGNADAHGNLGVMLVQTGQIVEGISEYEMALKLQPENPVVLSNLAWLLATFPDAEVRDGARAVQLAETAVRVTDDTAAAVDALRSHAAALAEVGRHDEAGISVRRAIQMARQAGNAALAERIQQEYTLYQAGFPFRDASLANGSK